MYESMNSLFSNQYLLSVFFIMAIPGGVKWYLIVALIYIFLMTNGIEYLFVSSLTIVYLLW